MSDKPRILIQFDTDQQVSLFDRVVAVDAGCDHLFSYSAVTPDQVTSLVHGAIFTRGAKDLHRTAIFIGGSDVAAGEKLLGAVRGAMLPQWGLQVSVLLDSNGCNTTAAAAVLAAGKHLSLGGMPAVVLGATGPVGQRVARLLAKEGAYVRVASRQLARAELVCQAIRSRGFQGKVTPVSTASLEELHQAVEGQVLLIAAGAAGVTLLPRSARPGTLRVGIDLNAVPPLGIEGIEVTDAGKERDGVIWYGALGVGGSKIKIHKAAVSRLFERNDQIMDAEEVYLVAQGLG
jgi:hypothetical protein